MIDGRNVTMICGGLVADPEVRAEGKLVRLRIGVDYAGSPREGEDQDNKSGYFTVQMWLNDDNPNTRFVKGQLEKGNFKKGSALQVVGHLLNDRYRTKEGNNAENNLIIAEAINYWGRPQVKSGDASETSHAESSSSEQSASFKF